MESTGIRNYVVQSLGDMMQKPGLDILHKDLPLLGLSVVGWTVWHLIWTTFLTAPLGRRVVVAQPPKAKKGEPPAKLPPNAKPSKLDYDKFDIAGWRVFVYTFTFIFGLWALWPEDWFLSNDAVGRKWPVEMPWRIEMYYMLSLGQYLHSTLLLFMQPKQSDFVEMLVHHAATLMLQIVSYLLSGHECGARLIIITDMTDPIMELGKCILYMGNRVIPDILFGVFSVLFIITRVFLYPYYCIAAAWKFRYVNKGGLIPFWHLCFGGVCILYVIFLFWTGIILRMAYNIYIKGEEVGDVRDDTMEESNGGKGNRRGESRKNK